VDFTFTRERPMRMGLRTTRIRIVDDAHATKTAIARSPRPRVGRRARAGRATRSRRHFTHRRSQWCARCDATRRDATRRDARARTRTIDGARARPRAGRRGGVRDGTTRDEDVALSDVGDRARRSGRAMASRATPWGSRRARMMGKKFARRVTPRRGRTRARGREDARAMGRRGHRHGDIAIERAVGVRRRANESRRGGVATRTRGATNGARLALSERRTAARRGRRRAGAADRARAGWINHPRARRGGRGWVATPRPRRIVLNRPREAPRLTERARVFFVLFTVVHWPHLYRAPHQGGANLHRSRRAPNRHQGDWREDRRGDEG